MSMKPIRILIVEDDPAIMATLTDMYKTIFDARGYQPTIEPAVNVAEARQLAKVAKAKPYDFVSLDVVLGDSSLTGLDVLATFKRFHSAWMVALLTGVEADVTVDKTMGLVKGDNLRKKLRRDAYASFPAERLLVVEKPSSSMSEEDRKCLLSNRVEQITLVYEEISRLRYVFRPIDVTSLERVIVKKGTKGGRKFVEATTLHWQIRFNCGEIRTLPNMAGFKTLHYLISRNRNESVTPEEALANEPKAERVITLPVSDVDPLAGYFESQGILWKDLSQAEQETLIRAALSLKIRRYSELRGFQDVDDISPAEESELIMIKKDLGPLTAAAENVFRGLKIKRYHELLGIEDKGELDASEEEELIRLHKEFGADANKDFKDTTTLAEMSQEGLHLEGGNYDQHGFDRRGLDSPAAMLFRARMKRVKDCLRENGFADFAKHLEAGSLQSTGANWSYNPPGGVEWTT